MDLAGMLQLWTERMMYDIGHCSEAFIYDQNLQIWTMLLEIGPLMSAVTIELELKKRDIRHRSITKNLLICVRQKLRSSR